MGFFIMANVFKLAIRLFQVLYQSTPLINQIDVKNNIFARAIIHAYFAGIIPDLNPSLCPPLQKVNRKSRITRQQVIPMLRHTTYPPARISLSPLDTHGHCG